MRIEESGKMIKVGKKFDFVIRIYFNDIGMFKMWSLKIIKTNKNERASRDEIIAFIASREFAAQMTKNFVNTIESVGMEHTIAERCSNESINLKRIRRHSKRLRRRSLIFSSKRLGTFPASSIFNHYVINIVN